jgi:hypothetical protein
MRRYIAFSPLHRIAPALTLIALAPMSLARAGSSLASAQQAPTLASGNTRFEVSFPASLHGEPITGRVFLFVSRSQGSKPRFQPPVIFLGTDVRRLRPGEAAAIDAATPGAPAHNLAEVPAGDYYVQAVLNVYTEFHRADGHVVWAHMDQWEGQQFNTSPGNLISEPQKVHLDPGSGYSVKVSLTKVLPPIEMPPDTEWVKRIKFQSKTLSQFWGHPIYIGATVLLPKGYEKAQ